METQSSSLFLIYHNQSHCILNSRLSTWSVALFVGWREHAWWAVGYMKGFLWIFFRVGVIQFFWRLPPFNLMVPQQGVLVLDSLRFFVLSISWRVGFICYGQTTCDSTISVKWNHTSDVLILEKCWGEKVSPHKVLFLEHGREVEAKRVNSGILFSPLQGTVNSLTNSMTRNAWSPASLSRYGSLLPLCSTCMP